MMRRERQKAVNRSEVEDHSARTHRLARAGEGAGKIDIQDVFDLFRYFFDSRQQSVGDSSTVDENIDAPEASPQLLEQRHHLALDGHVHRFGRVLAVEQSSELCRCSAISISITTVSPFAAKRRTTATPMPFAPPVTSTIRGSVRSAGQESSAWRRIHRRVRIPRLLE